MKELKPGMELDQKVHEFVMGGRDALAKAKDQREFESARRGIDFCPAYSTDIAAAWPIIEMFKDRGDYKIVIQAYAKDDVWTIKAYHREGSSKSCTTSAKTLPHAICLAALKAVEP